MSPTSLFMVKLGLFWPFLCPGGLPKPIKYWNNALVYQFQLYAPIHSHWECLETSRVLNSGIIQIWGKFPVIFGHFWVILCPEGLQTTQNQRYIFWHGRLIFAPPKSLFLPHFLKIPPKSTQLAVFCTLFLISAPFFKKSLFSPPPGGVQMPKYIPVFQATILQ